MTVERLGERSYGRSLALHPAGRQNRVSPVLIIAQDSATRRELLQALPAPLGSRAVRAASDTEGLGARIVVIGGPFPLAELIEVRAHPQLFRTPVVLFAPGKDLPAMDWRAMDVWPVIDAENPIGQLVGRVRALINPPASSHLDRGPAHLSSPRGP